MSIARIYGPNSSPNFERRLRVRQRVTDLAYLDIGADNGGIVLNLTNDGMGFQAVAPLGDQKQVSLRVQLPRSRTQIETMAEIVWLHPERRQAGVHFLDLAPATRAQIQRWINALLPPDDPLEVERHRTDTSNDSMQRHEPAGPARKDKWLSLMAEATKQNLDPENPPPRDQNQRFENSPLMGSSADSDHSDRPAQTHSSVPPAQKNTFPNSQWPQLQIDGTHTEEAAPQKKLDKLDIRLLRLELTGQPRSEQGSSSADVATGLGKEDRNGLIDWPIRERQILPPNVYDDMPDSLRPLVESAASAASSASTKPNPVLKVIDKGIVPAPAKFGSAQKWTGATILILCICLACFAIGILVGDRGKKLSAVQLAVEPTVAAPTVSSSDDASAKINTVVAPVGNHLKIRHNDSEVGHAPESLQPKVVPAPSALNLERTSQLLPARENGIPSLAAKPSESKSVPPAADVQTTDSPIVTPTIFAGRRLKPTDRFNPCHLSYRLEPTYPADAKQQFIQGAVKIHQIIGADGSVQSVKLLSGPPLLAPAALEAAKYWRYFPALLNGQPVETELDVEIDFRLPR